MNKEFDGIKKAKWIASPYNSCNTWNLEKYTIKGIFDYDRNLENKIIFAARDENNCLELIFNEREIVLVEKSDLAWKGQSSERGNSFEKELMRWSYSISKENEFVISIDKLKFFLQINNETLCDDEILEKALSTEPRKNRLMLFGIGKNTRDLFKVLEITDEKNELLWNLERDNVVNLGSTLIDAVPSLLVGKEVEIKGKILKATLTACARGFYETYINGEKVGEEYYAPGFTDYRIHMDFQEYDITKQLQQVEGDKCLFTGIVTKGYYSGFCGYSGAHVYGKRNSFIANIEIEYEDGKTDTIVTDKTWGYSDLSPVICADYLDGERYDANLNNTLVDKELFIDTKCVEIDAPGLPVPTNGSFTKENQPEFIFMKQDYEPAKVREIIKPIAVKEIPKNHFVYDFGQNLVGTIKATIKTLKNSRVRFRYGEMSYKNGEIYIQNVRTAANTDIYISSGDQGVFIPSLTSHGFRYVEVEGIDSTDDIEIEALVINNLRKKSGEFECSDENINKLHKNICWGQKGNSLLILTDCPQRNERMGWTGDAQVFGKTASFNMDVLDLTKKWLRDLREATIMYNRNGAIPDTAPLGGDNRPGPCGGWSDAACIVPWELYEEYADISILEDNYEMMKGWVDYTAREDREENGIQKEIRRGDHLAYDTSTPFELCATAYAARSCDYLARTADALGITSDAIKYGKRFSFIREAFCKEYLDARGDLKVHSQTAYALAIDLGLVPGSLTAEQISFGKKYNTLPEEVINMTISSELKNGFIAAVNKCDNHLSVGFLGISHLLPALTKINQDELAATILFNKTQPGWLYSVLNGATTIWERWNSYIEETGTFGDVNMNSFNHYAYGSVGSWIYENILGIKRTSIGYKTYEIKPKSFGGITYVKGYHDTVNGRINVDWKFEK